MRLFDIETCNQDEAVIRAKAPEWNAEEARTRVPKNYSRPEAINEWLAKDEANHFNNILNKAAVIPEYAHVVLVTTWEDHQITQHCFDTTYVEFHEDAPPLYPNPVSTEEELLRKVWRILSEDKKTAGWNLTGFDLWMLVRRSWILGVPVPKSVFNPFNARYPFSDRFICLMKLWQAGRWDEKFTSLNNALKACDIAQKIADGKEFPKLWTSNRPKALRYAHDEMVKLAELSARMGVQQPKKPVTPEEIGRAVTDFLLRDEDTIPV